MARRYTVRLYVYTVLFLGPRRTNDVSGFNMAPNFAIVVMLVNLFLTGFSWNNIPFNIVQFTQLYEWVPDYR